MSQQLKITFSDEDARWLRLAKASGISMSYVVRSMICEAGQHGGLEMTVRWMVERRISRLRESGYIDYAAHLQNLLDAAGYPVGYY